jgi:hypothetical protein
MLKTQWDVSWRAYDSSGSEGVIVVAHCVIYKRGRGRLSANFGMVSVSISAIDH